LQAMTIKQTRLFFPVGGKQAIQLEGVIHHPGGKNLPTAVICHPHSLYGGSMDVPLVVSIARTLVEHGTMALRFNFRGVGRDERLYNAVRGDFPNIRWLGDYQ
jgi:alpha/beta superfamily hydrolase